MPGGLVGEWWPVLRFAVDRQRHHRAFCADKRGRHGNASTRRRKASFRPAGIIGVLSEVYRALVPCEVRSHQS
jgi:hypothetical protein